MTFSSLLTTISTTPISITTLHNPTRHQKPLTLSRMISYPSLQAASFGGLCSKEVKPKLTTKFRCLAPDESSFPVPHMPQRLREIISQWFDNSKYDAKSRYAHFLKYCEESAFEGMKLYQVPNCKTPVWVGVCKDDFDKVYVDGFADSENLTAVLMIMKMGFTGHTVEEICGTSAEFFNLLGVDLPDSFYLEFNLLFSFIMVLVNELAHE